MIPATPNADTADSSPLVSYDDYVAMTGDTSSSESDFDDFLADALDQLQREMRRTLLYAQYTERLFLYKNGIVYPSATPFDVTQGISSPNQDSSGDVGIFQGDGIWVGWFVPLPSLPVWQGVIDPQTDITYTGGFVGSTSDRWNSAGGMFNLPAKLKRIICKTTWFMLNPAALPGRPGGVTSSSVGGIALGGELSSFMEADPDLRRAIKRYRKPQAKAWDAQVTT